jgi:carbonic anhydrase
MLVRMAPDRLDPERALARLMAGNARFVAGTPEARPPLALQRAELVHTQHPYALVLTCADSRVAPELVFDAGLGDLFVCRVGGNIVEPGVLASFEFALSAVGTPAVIMVMAHQHCGAVTAAVGALARGKVEGSVKTIADAIAPAVADAGGAAAAHAGVDDVIRRNAVHVARELQQLSAVISEAIAAGQLRIVPAYYSFEHGTVTLLSS